MLEIGNKDCSIVSGMMSCLVPYRNQRSVSGMLADFAVLHRLNSSIRLQKLVNVFETSRKKMMRPTYARHN